MFCGFLAASCLVYCSNRIKKARSNIDRALLGCLHIINVRAIASVVVLYHYCVRLVWAYDGLSSLPARSMNKLSMAYPVSNCALVAPFVINLLFKQQKKAPQYVRGLCFRKFLSIYLTASCAPHLVSKPFGLNPFAISICSCMRNTFCCLIFLQCKGVIIFLISPNNF